MTAKEFFAVVEDYYGTPYRPSVKAAVYELVSRKSGEYLSALYKILRLTYSNAYKQPPDELAVREAMREVAEGYPEFDPASYNRQVANGSHLQLTEDAGFIPEQVWSQIWQAVGVSEEEARNRHKLHAEGWDAAN